MPFYPSFRAIFIYGFAATSVGLMLLMLNIITIPQIITFLKLDPKSSEAQVITQVLGKMQEVTKSVKTMIGENNKLLSKVLNSAGMGNLDISKIKIPTDISSIPNLPTEINEVEKDSSNKIPANRDSGQNVKP